MNRHTCLSLLLLPFILVAHPAVRGDDESDFKVAYKMYQQAESRGDKKAMLEYSRTAWELGQRVYPPDSKSLPALAYNYGHALTINWVQTREAGRVLKESLALFERQYGPDAPELVDPLMELGRAHWLTGTATTQRSYFDRALAIVEDTEGRDSLLYASLSLESGMALLNESSSRTAGPYLVHAHDIFLSKAGTTDARTGHAAFWLGKYYIAMGKLRLAEEKLHEALTTFENLTDPSNTLELSTHAFLVEVYERKGDRDRATEHCVAIGNMTPAVPDQEYKPVFRPYPSYPMSERRMGYEGSVLIESTVDKQGFVVNPKVVESDTSFGLQQAALEAAAKARYAPRFVDGKPVDSPGIKIRYKFTMGEKEEDG